MNAHPLDASRVHFLTLSHDEQAAAIRRLASLGFGDYEIAQRTGWHVIEVRRALGPARKDQSAEIIAAPPQSAAESTAWVPSGAVLAGEKINSAPHTGTASSGACGCLTGSVCRQGAELPPWLPLEAIRP